MPDSLTELDAAKPKGPRIFVALVALLILLGLAWRFLGPREDGPIGEAEDPARVVLLGASDDVAQVLPQLGLEVEATDLASLALRARDEGAPSEASDVDAVLHWADLHGYGYVAFANPGAVEFGARPVTQDSADLNGPLGFAVFSVGDFAFPTKVTVDPLPATYDLPDYVELLRALFEQDKLAATLLAPDNLSIEAKPLYEKIRAAVDVKGAYGLVDQRARASQKDYDESIVAEEEAEPKPLPLRASLEETRAWPLANGSVLLLATAPSLVDPHTDEVEMSWNTTPRTFVFDPADGTRTRCEAQDAWADADVRVDGSGSVVLVAAADLGHYDVFTVAKASEGCAFTAAGSLATAQARGALGATGQLARIHREDEGVGPPMAEVIRPDDDHALQWQLPGCDATHGIDWLDTDHVAVLCDVLAPVPDAVLDSGLDSGLDSTIHAGVESSIDIAPQADAEPPSPKTWVYLVDITTGEVLALPWRTLEHRGHGLFRVAGPTLQLLARTWDGTLELGTLTQTLPALLASPPLDTAAAPPLGGADASVRALIPDAVAVTLLETDSSANVPVVSPTGTHVSYSVDTGRRWAQNLAVMDLRTKSQTRVAINRWALHARPAFTADGSKIVFSSQYSLRDGEGHVAQIVPVP